MLNNVVIVDYGLGNLKSVSRAVDYCGGVPNINADCSVISSAKKIILPGVGAFGEGMKRLTACGMDLAIKQAVHDGAYILGICLGMQMLLDCSEEFGTSDGLGLIKGNVKKIQSLGDSGVVRKIPHIGWSALERGDRASGWEGSPLENTAPGSPVYFVHSYMACPDKGEETIAVCDYDGLKISSVINHGKVWGMQFHPEKSGQIGLEMIKKFITMA